MECTNFDDVSTKWFVNPNHYNPSYLPQKVEDGRVFGTENEKAVV